jgi:hypothetical protein
VKRGRFFVACVALFAASLFAMADEPQQLLSQFLDAQKPAEQRASALAGLIADEQGVRALANATAARDRSVMRAMSALFESATPKSRALVMHAAVQTRDRDSYSALRVKALHDDDPEVRASALGAAAVFSDYTHEVIDALVKEIQGAQPSPALAAATQFAARFEVPEAIEPLLELLMTGKLGSRELAARTLAAYSSLPDSARPVLSSATETARNDAARLDTVYQFLPSAKNPSGTNTATNLQELLDRALTKVGAPRDASSAGVASPATAATRALESMPIEPTLNEEPVSSANQHSPAKATITERSQDPRRIWPWVIIVGVIGAVLLSWQLIRKPKSF